MASSELLSKELLSTLLKFYDLKEPATASACASTYEVIRTTSEAWAKVDRPRVVVFDKKNNCYYKVFFIKKPKDKWFCKKYDHIFFINAHFPNHLVTSTIIKENIWIVKQTIPKGILLSKLFLKPNTINEKIIDSFLNNLVWAKHEAHRLFPEKYSDSPGGNRYWDYAAGDSCASNIIYDIETNTTTNIDVEQSCWLTREEYLEQSYYRLLKHFKNFNSYPYCNFLSVLEIPKILDKCMMFIDKEIL